MHSREGHAKCELYEGSVCKNMAKEYGRGEGEAPSQLASLLRFLAMILCGYLPTPSHWLIAIKTRTLHWQVRVLSV